MQDLKFHYRLAADAITLFTLDGELKQIKIDEEPTVLEYLEANRIFVMKPSASTSSTTQPCDAGVRFLAAKTTNKCINDACIADDHAMIKVLKDVFIAHDTHPRPNSSKRKKMDPSHERMGVMGVLRVRLALTLTMRGDNVKDSFRVTGLLMMMLCIVVAHFTLICVVGIHPYSFDQIISQCRTHVT